jgi:hypothetical protein
MIKNVSLGNSESYGNYSYGLGYRGAVLGDKSGTFAGDYNAIYSNNSVTLGGEGLISLSSTPYQAVVGKYNNPNNNALFVVGAGGGDTNRVNILEVNNNSLTVTGSLSASGTMFASGGNSNQWNTAYTNLVNNSANYLSGASTSYVNTNFVKLSGDNMTGLLTNSVGISSFSLSAKYIDLVHTPANDGTNPVLRIGEYDTASGNVGFSGMYISYNENSNVFGISAQFAPSAGLPVVSIDRSGNTGIGTDAPNAKLTVAGSISASATGFFNNIATQNQVQYLSSGVVKVYQYYNATTNSLDTVFT